MRLTGLRVAKALFAVLVGTTSTLLTLVLLTALFAPSGGRAATPSERLESMLVEGMYDPDPVVRDRHIAASVLLHPESEMVRGTLEELSGESDCARQALAALDQDATCASVFRVR